MLNTRTRKPLMADPRCHDHRHKREWRWWIPGRLIGIRGGLSAAPRKGPSARVCTGGSAFTPAEGGPNQGMVAAGFAGFFPVVLDVLNREFW